MAYPTALDTFVDPVATDMLSGSGGLSHSAQHRATNAALRALQARVGADLSAAGASHDYRLAQLTPIADLERRFRLLMNAWVAMGWPIPPGLENDALSTPT